MRKLLWALGAAGVWFWLARRSKATSLSPGPIPGGDLKPEDRSPKPESDMRIAAIIDKARGELDRWDGRKETDAIMRSVLDEYWRSVGIGPQDPVDVPWSAAFVSHVIQSTVPEALLPSASHIEYARQAYRDRGEPGKYGAFEPYSLAIRPGDIIVTARGDGSRASFSDVQQGGDFFKTHGDIVTDVMLPAASLPTASLPTAMAIGGNVDNSVSDVTYPLTATGRLEPGSRDFVAVLRLQ